MNIYLHDRKLEITGQWTERQENSSTWQEVEGKRLNSPAKGGGAMAAIFTYMTGNWELLGKWTERQENSYT